MPLNLPRASQSAEAARAAAAQAEFNEKKWVWVPDEREGYVAGYIIQESQDVGVVKLAAGGEEREYHLGALSKMNPPEFDRVEDIANLTHLNEASVAHILRLRYLSDAIYTYSGLFLVAINPYTQLPLYSDAIIQQYRNKRRDDNAPHIFAIAERAWVSMGEERENQSVLITGESGAGKTENTKKVIQYLAAIAAENNEPAPSHSRSPSVAQSSSYGAQPPPGLPRSSSFRHKHTSSNIVVKGKLGLLEQQILQANPILEAFGNAQTARNNNSSRFGKFVRISFASDGTISGANIDWYLLEKSRVVTRPDIERNFHVFYQLLEGGGSLKDDLLLEGGCGKYEYLRNSRREIDGVNDREEFKLLKNALNVVGFSPSEQFDLFRIVAAILHIGNIEISADRSDQAGIKTPAQVERVCHLLGVPLQDFMKAVLAPKVLAGREWVTQARTKQQALDELSALCKTLYEKSFGALVERINKALDRPSLKSTFIGVLDIAGFEIFETNGFEQLCINYTNEKLQQFFNHHMFVLEQEEYRREHIEWDFVNFGLDLQPTIDLIESSGSNIGILSCLDEECIMPKATDATFTFKLNTLWASDTQEENPHPGRTKYTPAKFEQGFIVQHYAGKVEYRTEGWLEKNKDPLNDNLTRILASSSERYISGLFAEYADHGGVLGGAKKRILKKGAFRTVGQRHKEQLNNLMTQLRGTQPHFVRCIVPNSNKRPRQVDVPLVLDQLRCNGVLEGIRIARLGYPNRLPFVEFRYRYEILTPGIIPRGYMDGRKACLRMVGALELDTTLYKIGTSKIFFRAGVLAELEKQRDDMLFDIFSRLQAVARMWTARRQMKKILNRAVAIRTIQRNARVYGELREWGWWQLYTKVRPLLAATRNDEELRRKNMELELVKERAERDQREREALENLKMQLEQDKRKVEDQLEAERAIALEKDQLWQRSKQQEATLEDEIQALEADLETVQGQLERAMQSLKTTEENYRVSKLNFEEASRHLQRLEAAENMWKHKEAELQTALQKATSELDSLSGARDSLDKASEDLRRSLMEKDEDVKRLKERLEGTIASLESKLSQETKAKDTAKAKADALEEEARRAKDQVVELTRAATDYTGMIQKKESEMSQVSVELAALRREKDFSAKQVLDLQAQVDTLANELDVRKAERDRDGQARAKLQSELDELRALMEAKASEFTRRTEVERSKDQELTTLRSQASELQGQLQEIRRQSLEAQNKLKADVEASQRQLKELESSHIAALEKEKTVSSKYKDLETSLTEAERAKRVAESELLALRTRQTDLDGQLAEAVRAKEVLEKQLSTAQAKHQDYEDAVLHVEREKGQWVRQMEALKTQLEQETAKRTQLENGVSSQSSELAKLKERVAKADKDLSQAKADIQHRDNELKQMKANQNITIVKHIQVMKQAKEVTDTQLAQALVELQKEQLKVKSLEKLKAKISGEAEDTYRALTKELAELRSGGKSSRAADEKLSRAVADLEREKRMRDASELRVTRLQSELHEARNQLGELEKQLKTVQRAKESMEVEIASLVEDGDAQNITSKVRRDYEARIAQLEARVEEAELGRSTAERIKERIDKQQAELRRLISSSGGRDDFRERLLKQMQLADEEMDREFSARARTTKKAPEIRTYGNIAPSKRHSVEQNGFRPKRESLANEQQTNELRQQVHALELRIVASERVRQHLEASLKELTSDLENSDGTKQSLERHRAKIIRENNRLAALLEEEAEARRAAGAAEIDGINTMWQKFQTTIDSERESYAKLEESRKAVLVQQKTLQVQLEDQRRQIAEMTQNRKQISAELIDLKERLESEQKLRQDEVANRRRLQRQVQELEISSAAATAMNSDLQTAVQALKAKAEEYRSQVENADLDRHQAGQKQSLTRRALDDLERSRNEALSSQKATEQALEDAKAQISELESRLDEEHREMELFRRQITEDAEEERDQHQKELEERDFRMEQTRQKYQAELHQLSEEARHLRDQISNSKEENHNLRSDLDDLQLRYDDELYAGASWKKEKERLSTKILDLTAAYEASKSNQTEQQTQIVSLLSQVRELRAVLDDAEAERAALRTARAQLETRLNDIAQAHLDANKMSSDRVLQELNLEKQELRNRLDEQAGRVDLAYEELRKAKSIASEYQLELNRTRAENSELERKNAVLEKTNKELNVRVVDLETKGFANSPRPATSRRLETRIEELTNRLQQESLAKSEKDRLHRTADKTVKDFEFRLAESDRQRLRLEEELKAYEVKVRELRERQQETAQKQHQAEAEARRLGRQVNEERAKYLGAQRDLETLKNRMERPASIMYSNSPVSSPRK